MKNIIFNDEAIAKYYNSLDEKAYSMMIQLRELIYNMNGYKVEESLKWNQPSYKVIGGTPIRIDINGNDIYFLVHCQTNLINEYQQLFGDTFRYKDNRAIILNINEKIPEDKLKICIELAFNYHNKTNIIMIEE